MKLLNKIFQGKKSEVDPNEVAVKNLINNVVKEKGWAVFATRLHVDSSNKDKLSSYMVIGGEYKPADLDIALGEYEKMIDKFLARNDEKSSQDVNSTLNGPEASQRAAQSEKVYSEKIDQANVE